MLSPTRSPTIARIPSAVVVLGGVEAAEDLIVEGQVTGHISLPDHHLAITASAVIAARIMARSVTISGVVEGNILASERIELLPGASVRGHLTTPALLMVDGARFTGSVDPVRTEAALLVAKYRQRRAEWASG
jgi:cytoskeletal protein CcmA (bactofilin family)